MDLKKEIALNKKILVILVLISVLTIGVNVSYSLFQSSVKLDNVVEIHTPKKFPVVYKDPEGATKDLIEKVGKIDEGIYGINPEKGEICESDCKEYRYTGGTVKNYVKLRNIKPDTIDNDEQEMQDELWRIIGIFTDEESGEKYIRLVRNELLPEAMLPTNYVKNGTTYSIKGSDNYVSWNSGDKNNNDWATAGLQYYLNGEDESENKGYMSYLSDETKSMLEERTHYIGTVMYKEEVPVNAYKHERDVLSCEGGKGVTTKDNFPTEGCNVWSNNQATWKGSISIMYPSDYGFSIDISVDKSNWKTKAMDSFSSEVKNTSWMYTTMPDAQSKNSWMLSPASDWAANAINWLKSGYLSDNAVSNNNIGGARPVLNLKSNVKITNLDTADGSLEKPYELGI